MRARLLSVAAALAGLSCLAAAFLAWGDGQLNGPGLAARRLRAGATPEEAEFLLGLPRGSCAFQARLPSGSCDVSRPGLGSYFAPQHRTTLLFDRAGRLEGLRTKWFYRLDEREEAVGLAGGRPQPSTELGVGRSEAMSSQSGMQERG